MAIWGIYVKFQVVYIDHIPTLTLPETNIAPENQK